MEGWREVAGGAVETRSPVAVGLGRGVRWAAGFGEELVESERRRRRSGMGWDPIPATPIASLGMDSILGQPRPRLRWRWGVVGAGSGSRSKGGSWLREAAMAA